MPITSINSYRLTTEEFAVNWEQADGEMGATPLLLASGYDRANFVADRTALLNSMNDVESASDAARWAAQARDASKNELMTRARQFRGEVQGQITDKNYLSELTILPSLTQGYSKFMQPLRAMARLWARINANAPSLGLSGPLTLSGGYSLLDFQSKLDGLETLYEATEAADATLGQRRIERDNLAQAIHERMKQYRAIAPARLPANSPALAHLPRLSPAPGSTPPALSVTGEWLASINKVRLTWAVTTAATANKLQVRACIGSAYRNENEEVIADLPIEATHYETDWGLASPGALASFKVYVMTTTGNENGGKAVKIVRPET